MRAIVKIEPKKSGYWACTVKIVLDNGTKQTVMQPIGRGFKDLESALSAGVKKAVEWGGPKFEMDSNSGPLGVVNESSFVYIIWFYKAQKTDEH